MLNGLLACKGLQVFSQGVHCAPGCFAGANRGFLQNNGLRSLPVWADCSQPRPERLPRHGYVCLLGECWAAVAHVQHMAALVASNLFAGAAPMAALAVAVVPLATAASMEEDLVQMLAGALSTLHAAGCALVGGHSSEGAELAVGFAVSGSVPREEILSKRGMEPGLAVIITKPVGTGWSAHAYPLRVAAWPVI